MTTITRQLFTLLRELPQDAHHMDATATCVRYYSVNLPNIFLKQCISKLGMDYIYLQVDDRYQVIIAKIED